MNPPGTLAPSAGLILAGLKKANVSIVAELPESLLKSAYPALVGDPNIRYIRAASETRCPRELSPAPIGGESGEICAPGSYGVTSMETEDRRPMNRSRSRHRYSSFHNADRESIFRAHAIGTVAFVDEHINKELKL